MGAVAQMPRPGRSRQETCARVGMVRGGLASGLTGRPGNNFIVIERARILICSIDKNANTLQAHVAAAAMGVRRDGSHRAPAACQGERLDGTYMRVRYQPNATRLNAIFRDLGWRRAFVFRDPIERFVSAYTSKCAQCCYTPGCPMPKGDGCHNCHTVFGLTRDRNWSLAEVAERLSHSRSWANPHWLHQGRFCGGLEDNWRAYTHRIPFEQVGSGLAALFRGRHHLLAKPRLVEGLCNGSVTAGSSTRRTRAMASAQIMSEHTTSVLKAHYAQDYELIERIRTCATKIEKETGRHFLGRKRVWRNPRVRFTSREPHPQHISMKRLSGQARAGAPKEIDVHL